MEADIRGTQRKVVSARVAPLDASLAPEGIVIKGGVALPFLVSRQWSAPAGDYLEQWFLVVPGSEEVVFAGPARSEAHIWGLQSLTEIVDHVTEPFALEPGAYEVVFALGGAVGGRTPIPAVAAPAAAA
jgi:hypothetical protein